MQLRDEAALMPPLSDLLYTIAAIGRSNGTSRAAEKADLVDRRAEHHPRFRSRIRHKLQRFLRISNAEVLPAASTERLVRPCLVARAHRRPRGRLLPRRRPPPRPLRRTSPRSPCD